MSFCASTIHILPDAVLGRMVSFLDDRDATMFSSCNHQLRHQFPIVQLHPPVVIPNQLRVDGASDDGDDYECKITIPATLFLTGARSVQLSCRWKDQGWGNQKSQVAILATPQFGTHGSPVHPPQRIPWNELHQRRHGSRLVCYTANVAAHGWQPLVLKFIPHVPDENYHLYMKAGGGGGHALMLEDIRIHSVIVDKPDRSMSRNFRILSDLNVIGNQSKSPFLFQLLHTNIASLRDYYLRGQSQQSVDAHSRYVVQFMRSHGFDVTDSSLESIQQLLGHAFDTPIEHPTHHQMTNMYFTDSSDSSDEDSGDDIELF
jgi:hypothetical protein